MGLNPDKTHTYKLIWQRKHSTMVDYLEQNNTSSYLEYSMYTSMLYAVEKVMTQLEIPFEPYKERASQ